MGGVKEALPYPVVPETKTNGPETTAREYPILDSKEHPLLIRRRDAMLRRTFRIIDNELFILFSYFASSANCRKIQTFAVRKILEYRSRRSAHF